MIELSHRIIGCLKRRVWCVESGVAKVRRGLLSGRLDPVRSGSCDQIRRVALFRRGIKVIVPVAFRFSRQVKVVDRAVVVPVEMAESLQQWMPLGSEMAEMPFTEDATVLVANALHGLADGRFVGR